MKKFLNYSLLLFLFSIIAFACSKTEMDDLSVTSSKEAKPASPSSKLDAPTLSCVSSTGASITLGVQAGPSGARAGFSVQWMLKSDFDKYGWPSSSDINGSFCKASFSGVPGCSQYNLGTNGYVEVTIGDLFDACGASGGCGDLECGEEYVFRAFAHNEPGPGGKAKSDFSPDKLCSTLSCGDEGSCTYTQGYWKTHGPDGCDPSGLMPNAWSDNIMTNGLSLGGTNYDADALCEILNTPSGGTNLGLAHQLIAAILNQENGAEVPTDIQTCINDAKDFLLNNGGVYGTVNQPAKKEIRGTLTTCLANYNEGATGPGHCSSL